MSPSGTNARERLLEATMDYVRKNGVGDLTLRQLAAAVGTSHRMLVYHFGSKEGLFVEVIRSVEAEQVQALTYGLLLDLLGTGDRDSVHAALEQFLGLYQVSEPPKATSKRSAKNTCSSDSIDRSP